MTDLMNMRDKRVQAWNAAKAYLDSHRGNDGTLSTEDEAVFDRMMDDVDKLGKEVERLERLEAVDVEMSKATSQALVGAPVTQDKGSREKTGRASDEYKTNFCLCLIPLRMRRISFLAARQRSTSTIMLRWSSLFQARKHLDGQVWIQV